MEKFHPFFIFACRITPWLLFYILFISISSTWHSRHTCIPWIIFSDNHLTSLGNYRIFAQVLPMLSRKRAAAFSRTTTLCDFLITRGPNQVQRNGGLVIRDEYNAGWPLLMVSIIPSRRIGSRRASRLLPCVKVTKSSRRLAPRRGRSSFVKTVPPRREIEVDFQINNWPATGTNPRLIAGHCPLLNRVPLSCWTLFNWKAVIAAAPRQIESKTGRFVRVFVFRQTSPNYANLPLSRLCFDMNDRTGNVQLERKKSRLHHRKTRYYISWNLRKSCLKTWNWNVRQA